MNLGQVVKKMRKKSKVSQSELADMLGCSTAYICNIENNRGVSFSKVLDIAVVLKRKIKITIE